MVVAVAVVTATVLLRRLGQRSTSCVGCVCRGRDRSELGQARRAAAPPVPAGFAVFGVAADGVPGPVVVVVAVPVVVVVAAPAAVVVVAAAAPAVVVVAAAAAAVPVAAAVVLVSVGPVAHLVVRVCRDPRTSTRGRSPRGERRTEHLKRRCGGCIDQCSRGCSTRLLMRFRERNGCICSPHQLWPWRGRRSMLFRHRSPGPRPCPSSLSRVGESWWRFTKVGQKNKRKPSVSSW